MKNGGNFQQRQVDQEQNRRAKARKQWQESEWVLTCLRSKSGTPIKQLTDDEIFAWNQKLHP